MGEGDLQSEGPVGLSQCGDYIGPSSGEDVIDRMGRVNDASTTTGGVTCLPGHDVACFLGMKCLHHISMREGKIM